MSTKRPRNKIWNFFDVASESEKMAVCKLCRNEYSFKTTVFNLKKHLQHKHSDLVLPDAFEEDLNFSVDEEHSPLKLKSTDTNEDFLEQSNAAGDGGEDEEWKMPEAPRHNPKGKGRGKHRSSPLWHFFTISKKEENKAECKLCQSLLSYKTSITNLKTHLSNRHPENLEKLDQLPTFTASMDLDGSECSDQSDSVVCTDNYDMEDYEVVEEVMLDNLEPCEDTDAVGSGGDGNNSDLFASRLNNKRTFIKVENSPRFDSSKINKKFKPDPDPEEAWTRSCQSFGAYVASLMLQIPRKVAANYQVQIVKRLMDEALKNQGNIDK